MFSRGYAASVVNSQPNQDWTFNQDDLDTHKACLAKISFDTGITISAEGDSRKEEVDLIVDFNQNIFYINKDYEYYLYFGTAYESEALIRPGTHAKVSFSLDGFVKLFADYADFWEIGLSIDNNLYVFDIKDTEFPLADFSNCLKGRSDSVARKIYSIMNPFDDDVFQAMSEPSGGAGRSEVLRSSEAEIRSVESQEIDTLSEQLLASEVRDGSREGVMLQAPGKPETVSQMMERQLIQELGGGSPPAKRNSQVSHLVDEILAADEIRLASLAGEERGVSGSVVEKLLRSEPSVTHAAKGYEKADDSYLVEEMLMMEPTGPLSEAQAAKDVLREQEKVLAMAEEVEVGEFQDIIPEKRAEPEVLEVEDIPDDQLMPEVAEMKKFISDGEGQSDRESEELIKSLLTQMQLLEVEKEALREKVIEETSPVSVIRSCRKEQRSITTLSDKIAQIEEEAFLYRQQTKLNEEDLVQCENEMEFVQEEFELDRGYLEEENESLRQRNEQLQEILEEFRSKEKELLQKIREIDQSQSETEAPNAPSAAQ